MKVTTKEQLNQSVNAELIWRKKELSDFRSVIVLKSHSESKRKALLRGGVTLLYAHFEGFCKNAAELYLEFVSRQRLNYNQLKYNWLVVAQREVFNEASQTSKFDVNYKIIDFLLKNQGSRSQIPVKNIINTKSNLSSSVLKEMMKLLGLDYSKIAIKEKLIDEKLLKNRNMIAHGEYVEIGEDDYLELSKEITWIMNEIRDQIDNSAQLESYKI